MTWRLVGKDLRELWSSRAWLALLVVLGPLVGQAFGTAVATYGELSAGAGGGNAALAQGMSPLDGIVVPTFGAYALGVLLLFPFVVIRLVAAERENGAWGILVQGPASIGRMLAAKVLVLTGAWLVAWAPGLLALAWWRLAGGHLHAPEVAAVLLGHLLRAVLAIAVAALAAAVTGHAATAAVVALAITLGTWALDFYAQVHGGTAAVFAAYTPEAMLRTFEQGEVRGALVALVAVLSIGGLTLAGLWLTPGQPARRQALRSAAVALVTAALAVAATRVRAAGDWSEDRRNSFAPADEAALADLPGPLDITVHLAPEDPRLADLERGVLRKLRRIRPDTRITTAARSASGLFEGSGRGYGEVWYQLGGQRAMSRSTTVPIVLETIYGLAGRTPPPAGSGPAYPGYPHVARLPFLPWAFNLCWPLVVLGAWLWPRRRR